jgi:hypothetical protein
MAGAACDIDDYSSAPEPERRIRARLQALKSTMPATQTQAPGPRWYLIPARILLVTFLLTLLSFAISLLFGIVGLALQAHIRGTPANMTLAYRNVALPVAVAVGAIALIGVAITEIKDYRQSKALAEIERRSR